MSQVRSRSMIVGLTAALASAAIVLGLWALFTSGGSSRSTAPQYGVADGRESLLLAVDEHGAVVTDGRRGEAKGVRRSGQTVWRSPQLAEVDGSIVCLVACPNAVASSSLDSMNSAQVPDPAPTFLGAGSVAVADHFKRNVLLASAKDTIYAYGDEAGAGWLELRHRGASTMKVALKSTRWDWLPEQSGREALILSALPGEDAGFEATPLGLRQGRWSPLAPARHVASVFGCVGGRGELLLATPKPTMVLPSGKEVVVGALGDGGACAFSADAVILASYSMSAAGPRTRFEILDRSGRAIWRSQEEGEVKVAANPIHDEFLTLSKNVATVRDQRGKILRRHDHVVAARYTAAGSLVIVTPAGDVRWISRG